MEAPGRQESVLSRLLPGVRIAAGTGTELKPLSLLTPVTQRVSYDCLLFCPHLSSAHVIAKDSEARKEPGTCPKSNNYWTANSPSQADSTASSPHSLTNMHRTLLPFLMSNSVVWVTGLIGYLLQGMYSLVALGPLRWQITNVFWITKCHRMMKPVTPNPQVPHAPTGVALTLN